MNTMKKCISVLLAVLLTINMLPVQSYAATENTTEFLGGCGTEEEPYLISTWEHLDNVRNYPDAYYELVCNLEGAPENDSFEPISFGGNFDGKGYWLRGLGYNWWSDVPVCVFGTNVGTIQNLGIVGSTHATTLVNDNQGTIKNCYSEMQADLTNCNPDAYGAIATTNSQKGVIQECYFTGEIYTDKDFGDLQLGTIVGVNRGTINGCYNEGEIKGTTYSSYIGGLVGTNYGMIKYSFNLGTIGSENCSYGNTFVGGTVGKNLGNISDCYNGGTISATDGYEIDMGGIAGNSSGTISRCYNLGNITCRSESGEVGGIIGRGSGHVYHCYNTGTIYGYRFGYGGSMSLAGIGNGGVYHTCYNIGAVNGEGYEYPGTWPPSKNQITGGGTAISCYTGVPNDQSYYVDFDFENTWFLNPDTGYEYPQLYSNPQVQASEIALITAPTCVEFLEDTIPDLSDGRVKITYADGYEVKRPLKDYMFPGLDNTKVGTQTVTLQYGTCKSTDTLTFNVIAKELVSIDMATLPNKTNYVMGQSFNFSGATVALSYNNNKTVSVPISECEISYGDIQVGIVPVTVTYGEFTTTFDMTVREKVMKKITVNVPTKLSYIETQDLDLTGGSINIIYESEDDYAEQIELTLDMISGYNKNQIGDQTLTVTYEGKTATFVVNVSARSLVSIAWVTKPNKLTYLEAKETLDVTGGTIRTIYDNGAIEIIDLTPDMVSRFDNTDVGTQQLTVRFGEKKLYYNVEIVAKSLAEIEISQAPNKGIYKIDEETVDVSGGKILLIYNNDTTEEITMTEDMVSDLDATSAGIKDVLVTYEGKTTSFSVQVIDMIIESEDVMCLKGSTIQVPIYLTNGSGFSYLKLKVLYDTMALELVSVENQGVLGGMFTTSQSISTNPYIMSWSNALDLEGEGCIAILNFKVLEDAPIGDYIIDIVCAEASDQNLDDVTFIVEDSNVTVCDYIFGDVNRDNVVNGKDATLLMRYLAEWDVTIDFMAANVDLDNVVNGKDLVLLMQYLAEWDVTLG